MNKRMRNVTVKGYFNGLTIVYFGIIFSMLLLSAVFCFVRMNEEIQPTPPFDKTTAMLIAGAVTAVSVLGGRFLYNSFTAKIPIQKTLAAKMNLYRMATIIRFALSELPVIVSVVLFFLTAYYELFIFAGIGLLYFFTLKPSKQQFTGIVNPDLNELKILDDPAAVVMQTEISAE